MHRIKKNHDDHIYINSVIQNTTNKDIAAEYSVDISESYLQVPSDYYCAIARFEIPNVIQIFTFLDNTYQITLSYNGTDFSEFITFTMVEPNNPSSRKVWNVQHFLRMINETIEVLFSNLKLAFPGSPPSQPPFFVFEEDSLLFSLYIQQLYDPVVAGAPTIELFFNNSLMQFFSNSFDTLRYGILPNGKDYKFLIYNQRNNIPASPIGYYRFLQTVNTLYQWYEFYSLIIASNEIPTTQEYIVTQDNNGNSVQFSMIADFLPDIDGKNLSNFIFNPNFPKLVDMRSNTSLKRFGYKIFYTTKNGAFLPYLLPSGYSISVKFSFYNKSSPIS